MNKTEKKIHEDLISAMKNKNVTEVDTLRAIKTAIKNAMVATKNTDVLSEGEVIKVLQKQADQRLNSYFVYKNNGRMDLAEKEEQEGDIIQKYLPKFIEEFDLTHIVESIMDFKPGLKMGEIVKCVKEDVEKIGLLVDAKLIIEIIKTKNDKSK